MDKHGQYQQGEFNEFAGDVKVLEIELGDLKWKGTQYGVMLKQKGLL